MRVDFHIHSFGSKYKDKDKVKDLTIDNIQVLIDELNKNHINMCAITDHDNFEYDLYIRLKQEEKKNEIQKVLPAIEFSVEIDNKVIHIITVFDDSDNEKLKKIQSIVFGDGQAPKYDSNDKKAFTEKTFKDIISRINLNVIMIAHQKNTPKSKDKRKNDVMTLGEDKFAQLVFLDYFDVYEFKNSNNELFNKRYFEQNENNIKKEKLRFITGTDCHNWNEYSKEIDKTEPVFLKCLPTFKGLSLAVTDYRRIKYVDSLFSQSRQFLKEIKFKIDGIEHTIPLSRGINVIIGNNSIGKSLLIHKLTDYKYIDGAMSKNYESYLEENNVEIVTKIEQKDIYAFDKQGAIRKYFEKKKFNLLASFKDRFPLSPTYLNEKNIVKKEIEKYFIYLENKQKYKELLKKLQIFSIVLCVDTTSLQIKKIKEPKNDESLKDLLDECERAKISLKNILENIALEEKDRKITKSIIEKMNKLQEKYLLKKENSDYNIQKISVVNKILTKKQKELADTKKDDEKKQITFNEEKTSFIDIILELFEFKSDSKKYNSNIDEITLQPVMREVGDYNFIAKCFISKIDNEYILNKLKQPFRKNKKIDLNDISIEELDEVMAYRDEGIEAFEDYKKKILANVDKDFEIKNTILHTEIEDVRKEMSSGFNSKIYFDILSYDTEKNGIYIIDQPEDDVAPTSIKEYLLSNFKEMSENRQIILITHNPQFIVNLDVDNVIFLSKNEDKINIQSGALEYKNDEYDILNIISEHIDGGIETIKGRWKKYEKGI